MLQGRAISPFLPFCCLVTLVDVPQVVSATEDEIGPGVQGGAHPAQAAVTAGAFQTVLMPEPV